MKVLSRFILSTTLLFSPFTQADLLSITETDINHYLSTRLAEKVPLKDKIGIPNLFQLDYQLSDLQTKIGHTPEKRVEITGIIQGLLKAKGKKYDANVQLNLDTRPYLDSEKGTIYLKDIRLLNWQATPNKYQDELHMFLPILFEGVANVLNNTPVYRLDETKTKEALVKKFGKAIIIEQGELRLETKIF